MAANLRTTTDRVAASDRTNLLGHDRQALEGYFLSVGERRFRAQQVLKWAHQDGVAAFDTMTNLSKALRAQLTETAELRGPTVVRDQWSRDGTRKWLLRLDDGNCIEAVLIPDDERRTLCVSSQVGCALNCSFCATGHQGFSRNLTAAEIIGQIWTVHHTLRVEGDRGLTNVVFMGMGEPLLNFDNVVQAVRLIEDDLAYGLSWRRVTVSTAGMVPEIERLAGACNVSLALSLHAPDDALRNELVPLNRKYPLARLMTACRRFVAVGPAHRAITIEYVMIEGVNDTVDHAHRLADLLGDLPCKVNLIPFNPFPGTRYRRSPEAVITRFQAILHNAGLVATLRRPRGDDIDAACGQLAGEFRDRTRRRERMVRQGAGVGA